MMVSRLSLEVAYLHGGRNMAGGVRHPLKEVCPVLSIVFLKFIALCIHDAQTREVEKTEKRKGRDRADVNGNQQTQARSWIFQVQTRLQTATIMQSEIFLGVALHCLLVSPTSPCLGIQHTVHPFFPSSLFLMFLTAICFSTSASAL